MDLYGLDGLGSDHIANLISQSFQEKKKENKILDILKSLYSQDSQKKNKPSLQDAGLSFSSENFNGSVDIGGILGLLGYDEDKFKEVMQTPPMVGMPF